MVYFDNSATTPVSPEAIQAATEIITNDFGNPSAVHKQGINAKIKLEQARGEVSSLLGCTPAELYFSHSGTLANNTAIFGSVKARKKQGNRIITSSVEHPSVARCMDELEKEGFEVIRLGVGKDGKVRSADLCESLNDKTILISIMMVNNETGAVNDIKKLASVTHKTCPRAIFHTDAIQGFGKLTFKASNLGADLITVSGHKIHALKGVGALYIKKGLNIPSYVFGGGQENGLFSGTEPMPAIASFGAAAKSSNPAANIGKVSMVRDYIKKAVIATGICTINSPDDALPYILNISVPGIPSQVLINYLSAKEIYISAGSACKRGHRSEVLVSAGLAPDIIDSAVRISLSKDSTTEEAEIFINALNDAIKEIKTKL